MCVGSENNLRYYSLVTDHLYLETWSPRGLELTHKVGWVSRPVSLGINLALPPQSWNYRHAVPCSALFIWIAKKDFLMLARQVLY